VASRKLALFSLLFVVCAAGFAHCQEVEEPPLQHPPPFPPYPLSSPTIETKSLLEGRSIHSSATYNPTVLPLTHVLTHFGRSKKRMTSLRARFRVLPVAVFSRQQSR
jgi:hypothetical protein